MNSASISAGTTTSTARCSRPLFSAHSATPCISTTLPTMAALRLMGGTVGVGAGAETDIVGETETGPAGQSAGGDKRQEEGRNG